MNKQSVLTSGERFNPALLQSMLESRRAPGLRLRRRNPVVTGFGEKIEWTLYDSFSIAANTAFTNQNLFQNPIGTNKTLAATNLRANGKMANGETFKVRQLRMWISNDTVLADVHNIQRNLSVTFRVRNKVYFEGIAPLIPAGTGAMLSAAAQVGTAPAGSAPLFATSNGGLDPRAGFIFDEPGIVITPEENVSVEVKVETAFNTTAAGANPAGVGTTIYFFLDGVLYRGVS